MKRTPLQRKTPLKRTGWIKRVGKDTAKLKRETDPLRAAFVSEVGTCMVCQERDATQCHEIASGNSRKRCLVHQELWMALCDRCHKTIHRSNTDLWPLARQMAKRLQWAIANLNRIRRRAPTAVTAEEVKEYL